MLAAVLAALVVVVLIVPYFVNVDSYRGLIEQKLSESLNRRVKLNALQISLLPAALETSDVHIADDPAFQNGDFISVQKLKLHMDLGALIRGRIRLTSLEMVGPNVWLVRNRAGVWNVSSLGNTAPGTPIRSASVGVTPTLTGFDVSKFSMKDGRLSVVDKAHPNDSDQYDIPELSATDLSTNGVIPFTLTLSSAGRDEPLNVEGQLGPIDWSDVTRSPGQGTFKAKKVHFGKIRIEDLSGKFLLAQQELKIDPLDFTIYSGKESGSATVFLAKPDSDIQIRTRLSKMDVNQFLSDATANKDTFYGSLNADASLALSGGKSADQFQALKGEFSIDMEKGRWAHVNVMRELGTAAQLMGLNFSSKETPITKLSGKFDVANGWARTTNLQVSIPDIDMLAKGGFSFNNELQFDVVGNLTSDASQHVRSATPIGGLMSALLGNKNQQVSIPFVVTGTFDKPHFKVDTRSLLEMKTGNSTNGPGIQNTIQSIQDLFKKKKN